MTVMAGTSERERGGFPPLQAEMAREIEAGRIFYAQSSARWFDGPGEDDLVRRERGRALRTMRGVGDIETTGRADQRRAQRVRLTAAGRRRFEHTQ